MEEGLFFSLPTINYRAMSENEKQQLETNKSVQDAGSGSFSSECGK
jgi:hypothetical protein